MAGENSIQEIDTSRFLADASKFYGETSVKNIKEVSSKDILDFAKSVLLYLFILVIFVFATSYLITGLLPSNSPVINVVTTVLDITKTAVPSIATLVLGFYFGKRDVSSS